MGLKKRCVLCYYWNMIVYLCVFYILIDVLVLVCRYLFRYIILSVKYWVFCDKKRIRVFVNCYMISGW